MTEEQTEKLIRSRIAKSKKFLFQAEQVFKFKFYDNCINRTYYACFYIVNALLLKHGYKPKSHSGVRTILNKHFSGKNQLEPLQLKFFSELSKLRSFADYDAEVEFEKNITKENLETAKIFIAAIEKLILDAR